MTYLEIDKAMVDITQKMCEECKARLDAIPSGNITEKKPCSWNKECIPFAAMQA